MTPTFTTPTTWTESAYWLAAQTRDYTSSASGFKNVGLKVTYTTLDWFKELGWKVSPEQHQLRQHTKTFKNFMGVVALPGKVLTAAESWDKVAKRGFTRNTAEGAIFDSLAIVPEVADGMAALDTMGVWKFDAVTLWCADKLNLVSLFLIMFKETVKDVEKIQVAYDITCEVARPGEVNHQERVEKAERVVKLALVHLAMAVSYVALAVIALTPVVASLGFGLTVAIPYASTLILLASTTALASTLIHEFGQRAYREPGTKELTIPAPIIVG